MRHPLAILTVTVSVALTALVRADDLVTTRFGDYLESLRAQVGIPGLAAVIAGANDITWERGFGQQNVERAVATRTDTPFQVDGVTQIVAASMILWCVEEGRMTLDDRIGQFAPGAGDATLRQILSHTSQASDGLVFSYQPDRLAPLTAPLATCHQRSYLLDLADVLDRMGMYDSVPGSEVASLSPMPGDISTRLSRYTNVLGRLATPYAVDGQGRATPSRYPAGSLTPSSGLVSTARDLAKFDLGLKKGALLRAESIARAWTPPIGRNGQRLPHGLGWFVQTYNGEQVVWQFGIGENASSSLLLTLPGRQLTLILLANSSGLSKGFNLAAGDVTSSPFAKLFLGIFVR